MTITLLYRLAGAAGVALGLTMGWFFIGKPLEAAMRHAPMVRYDAEIFVVAPMLVVAGLFYLVGGGQWPYRDVERKTLTPVGWALIAAIAIAGGGSFLVFKQQFDALGYQPG